MKSKKIPVAFKAFFLFLACAALLSFTEIKFSNPGAKATAEKRLTEAEFHDNVASIISGKGLSQQDLARMMSEAELRKSEDETASKYVENYMNAHFKPDASMLYTNHVSIAAPGQADLNQTTECDITALREVYSGTIGYYYAYAIRCNGTYKYDAKNYTGGSYVYVRAEAGNSLLEAFILF